MAEEKNETPSEGRRGKLAFLENKAILLGAIVIVQAVLAIGLTQFLILPRLGMQSADATPEQPAAAEQQMPDMGVLVGLEEIIVTLQPEATGKKARYLRINVDLEVKDQVTANVVATRLPQLRDLVIMTLSDKTADDLARPEGKKGLRDEIFRKISEKMPAGALMNVYFSDLVVQ